MRTYAVIIPVYNEAALFPRMLARLEATPPVAPPPDDEGRVGPPLKRLIVVVDDGSTDGTRALVEAQRGREGVAVVLHERNRGKGAAVRSGLAEALRLGADVVLIHDADLEYDPRDHGRLLAPILDGRADAVLGSRFLGETHRVLYFWHSVANHFITLCSNMLTNLNLTDIECCLKAMRREVAERLDLREERFGVEPEIVAKLSRIRLRREEGDGGGWRPLRVYEVPVSYAGRTYEEGKKITWRDGVSALRCIVKYALGAGEIR